MTKFEKSDEEKARKEHESAANVASTIATGERGLEQDALAQSGVTPAQVRGFIEFLQDYEKRLEQIEERAEVLVYDELPEEEEQKIEEEIGEVVEESRESLLKKIKALMAKIEEE